MRDQSLGHIVVHALDVDVEHQRIQLDPFNPDDGVIRTLVSGNDHARSDSACRHRAEDSLLFVGPTQANARHHADLRTDKVANPLGVVQHHWELHRLL